MIKLKLWEATLKIGLEVMGQEASTLATVKVVSEHFEKAATMAIEATAEQFEDAKRKPTSIELVGLQSLGHAWTNEIEVMRPVGSIN